MGIEPIEQADRRACARQINRLLAACKNDVLVQNAAAAVIKNPSKRARLRERARRRDLFVRELDDLVHSLVGRSSLSRASFLVSLRGVLHRLRATAIGDNEGDAYGACSRVETKTEEAYASTLEMPLPESVRAVLARQHDEIARDRDELRELQFSH